MQYIFRLRFITVKLLLIICMMFSTKSAIAANTSLFLLKGSPKNQNPSLSSCLQVLGDGIRVEIPSFKHDKYDSNKALYIYRNEQWVIEVSEGKFRCDYLGELYEKKLMDSGNLTLRDKIVAVGDKCGPVDEYDKLCSRYLGKKVITDSDLDICFQKEYTLSLIKKEVQQCLGDYFLPN